MERDATPFSRIGILFSQDVSPAAKAPEEIEFLLVDGVNKEREQKESGNARRIHCRRPGEPLRRDT
ncbi:MAG TPA: hypothetical protein VNY05_44185 [Candidatus Acidoferrales bacterium]|jgi:hypothetical protein|nr:hypothetical protein [Candidatus Acidoferrales bacterium]